MDAKDHIGSPIDLAPIRMGRDEAEETVKAGHGGEGGGDLFAGERTGGGEDARVYAPPVVEEVVNLTSSQSPPAVPRTRRSTPEVMHRRGSGRRREEGDHFSFGM